MKKIKTLLGAKQAMQRHCKGEPRTAHDINFIYTQFIPDNKFYICSDSIKNQWD